MHSTLLSHEWKCVVHTNTHTLSLSLSHTHTHTNTHTHTHTHTLTHTHTHTHTHLEQGAHWMHATLSRPPFPSVSLPKIGTVAGCARWERERERERERAPALEREAHICARVWECMMVCGCVRLCGFLFFKIVRFSYFRIMQNMLARGW